jgi:hypothetical protein
VVEKDGHQINCARYFLLIFKWANPIYFKLSTTNYSAVS